MRVFVAAVTAVSLAATAIPIKAQARSGCEERAHRAKVTGTVLGAIGGALLGNAVSHHGGALVGGVGGAVVGNQLSRRSCDYRGYHYYHHHHAGYAYRHVSPYGRGPVYRAAPAYAPAPAYAAPRTCGVRTQSYYNDRGELVTRQVEAC